MREVGDLLHFSTAWLVAWLGLAWLLGLSCPGTSALSWATIFTKHKWDSDIGNLSSEQEGLAIYRQHCCGSTDDVMVKSKSNK
jgi:hypothetical protein